MAPPVDRENHANKASVETSEIPRVFKRPDKMIAAAWQHSIGINKRSKISHGRSSDVEAGTNDVRRNELRLIEPRLKVSKEARRISLFYQSEGRENKTKE